MNIVLIVLLFLVILIEIVILFFVLRVNNKKEKFDTPAFKKVVYINTWSNDFENDIIPVFTNALNAGVSHILLSFVIQEKKTEPVQIVDAVNGFRVLTSEQKTRLLSLIHDHHAHLLLSFGGAEKVPCPFDVITDTDSYYKDPSRLANDLVAIARENNFDGIDLDVEHLIGRYYKGHCPSGDVTQDTDVEAISSYLATVSITIKQLSPSLLVTHAPQYPYFGPSYFNVYTLVEQKAKDAIDFYNVQYYNTGDTSTYDSVFITNPYAAAVKQLLTNGIPSEKIVVGKSIQGGDVMDLPTFSSWIPIAAKDPELEEWTKKGGVMIWELFTVSSQSAKDIKTVIDFFQTV